MYSVYKRAFTMDKIYTRKIENRVEAERFCKNILYFDVPEQELITTKRGILNDAINDLMTQENLLSDLYNKQSNTFDAKENRVEEYRADAQREILRLKIAKDCLSKARLPEENINEDEGGMLPNTALKKKSQFYLVIGLPASGKSSISEKLADMTGSVYLDADIVKRKIPEFKVDTRGASLVHLESNYILRPSSDFGKIPDYNIMINCFQNKCNIVYNMIGDDFEWLKEMILMVKEKDYDVHLLLVELDRLKCVQRAYNRFKEKSRYISLPLIFDVYANNPTISFYKCVLGKIVESYAYINNDVGVGEAKIILENSFSDKKIIEKIAKGENKNGKNKKKSD